MLSGAHVCVVLAMLFELLPIKRLAAAIKPYFCRPKNSAMHICFVMTGLPHYVTLLLNKLVTDHQVEITLIKPRSKSDSVGAGVHEDGSSRRFHLLELEEGKTWYGKNFLQGLGYELSTRKPDAVVLGWPYVLAVVMLPSFWKLLKTNNIRFIYRDIPFNMPPWGEVADFYFGGKVQREDFSTDRQTSWLGFVRYWLTAFVRRLYIRKAHAHIMYTDEAYRIIGSYGVPREKIFVTANSPDTDLLLDAFEQVQRGPTLLPVNPYRLIHVGRLVKWKRVDLILEAVQRLQGKFPDIELLVIGTGPEEKALQDMAANMGLSKRVRFIGGVYEPLTLGQYLHESAIYVLAGMGGLSINDAMCFAKPVVCSVADGTERRLVREAFNGHYFENGNADSLTEKLEALLDSPEKIRAFGANSLSIIRDEINIHSVLRAYVKAFEFALEKS